jgi:hypothetical protein
VSAHPETETPAAETRSFVEKKLVPSSEKPETSTLASSPGVPVETAEPISAPIVKKPRDSDIDSRGEHPDSDEESSEDENESGAMSF